MHMLKQLIRNKVRSTLIAVLVLAVALVLAGCNVQPAGVSTDEHAAENRQYMALLNQKTSELEEVLAQFQEAVSTGDAVNMKAAASEASKIVESIEKTEATESLADVKEAYVKGLSDINTAMNDYAALYSNVASGSVMNSDFERQLKAIQLDYDKAYEELTEADELLTQLANE